MPAAFTLVKYFVSNLELVMLLKSGNTKGGSITVLFDWFGISCMTTDNFLYIYFQNRLIQTSQTGGQQYSDTSPFIIPWSN
jgi:hypothetical protein